MLGLRPRSLLIEQMCQWKMAPLSLTNSRLTAAVIKVKILRILTTCTNARRLTKKMNLALTRTLTLSSVTATTVSACRP